MHGASKCIQTRIQVVGVLLVGALLGPPWLAATPSAQADQADQSGQSGQSAAGKSEPTEGQLVTHREGTQVAVPLAHTRVDIQVLGHLAETTLTQVFQNPYDERIEAIYLFPLPTGAAVRQLDMVIGERRIAGTIELRPNAERIYQRAKSRGRVAALLTQERPNLFTQAVANIDPGARIEVTIRYAQTLSYERGGYELVFPMVAGPRYLPGGAKDETIQPAVLPPDQRPAHDIDLSVAIDAGVSLRGLHSPSHRIEHTSTKAGARVRIASSDTIPNKDFILRYTVAGPAPGFALMAHRDSSADARGWFVLLAQPPASAEQVMPREIVFALDTSSSMTGPPLAKAKQLIRTILGGLRPDDTFQIVRFSDRASALASGPIANKPNNLAHTIRWLDRLSAGGGTELAGGVEAALAVPHDPARLRIIVFVTDGYIGNESEILALVGHKMGSARLFSFGVGSAVNRYLLEEMAALGRGAVQVVRPDEDTQAAVTKFYQRIDAPVLTDIKIDWQGLAVSDWTPAPVPDLFAGQPLVIAGRYDAPGAATMVVRGRQAGRPVQFEVPVTLPAHAAEHPSIAGVWARRRIHELERQLLLKRDPAVEDEIRQLALAHRIMSRYTAFVAVDSAAAAEPNAGAPRRVRVPVEVPQSVRRIEPALASGGSYGAIGYGTIGVGGGGVGYGRASSSGTVGYGSASGGGGTGSVGVIGHGRGGSSSPQPRRVALPHPQIRIGVATVTGSLDKDIIRRYIRRRLSWIRYCYEKELMQDQSLAGLLITHFTITPGGTVSEVRVSGVGGESLHTCVSRALSLSKFPAVKGGGLVQVRYPFNLTSTWSKPEGDAAGDGSNDASGDASNDASGDTSGDTGNNTGNDIGNDNNRRDQQH